DDELVRRRAVPSQPSEPGIVIATEQDGERAEILPEERPQHVGIDGEELDLAVPRGAAEYGAREVADHAEAHMRAGEVPHQLPVDRRLPRGRRLSQWLQRGWRRLRAGCFVTDRG